MRPRQPTSEKTCFQEASPYDPATDSKADVAVVYGLDATFEKRVEAWRKAGYRIHVMTGVAWGDYASYVRGEWDGVPHYEDAQTETGGFKLEHGISQGRDIFYMVPSLPYTRYLGEKLRRVVDAGAIAIHLEEPEFWIRAGYGAGFEREWQAYYGEPWQDPTSSPDARFKASRLMQHLYTRSLTTLFADLKQYAREKGIPDFKCYVPTHSLINYAHWRIISPESQLLSIPDCDGIIGQVWTGTSRTPNVYRGEPKQRTFEASYCEYAACAGMVRGTGKKLWQLADPIEDNPHYSWDDYRFNWECTVVGSLLVEDSQNFEIMPWPRRIFKRNYPTQNLDTLKVKPLLDTYYARLVEKGQGELESLTRRAMELFESYYQKLDRSQGVQTIGFANLPNPSGTMRFGDVWSNVNGFYKLISNWPDQEDAQRIRSALSALYENAAGERSFIPAAYATELQVVFNALADMDWPGETQWLSGMTGVGLALSDTLMYQRAEPSGSDPDMSSLYGLALPLVKHGAALSIAQMERFDQPGYLDHLRILVLTYEGQKPPSAQAHEAILAWVKKGNALVLFGRGDAYNQASEWWNRAQPRYLRPQDHLTELAGLGIDPAGSLYPVGRGWILIASESPKELADNPQGPEMVMDKIKTAIEKLGLPWKPVSTLALRRGPYLAAAGMDEGTSYPFYSLPGLWINLFDPELAVLQDPSILPETRWLLYDLSRCPQGPWVIASAGRIENETPGARSLTFQIAGMANTTCCFRARVPAAPAQVSAGGVKVDFTWEPRSQTILVKFPNQIAGMPVEITW